MRRRASAFSGSRSRLLRPGPPSRSHNLASRASADQVMARTSPLALSPGGLEGPPPWPTPALLVMR